MAHSMIWGVILLLLGLSLIAKTLFGVSLPLIRIALGAGCMYAGVLMVTSLEQDNFTDQKTITFGSESLKIMSPLEQYTISFGRANLDFSQMARPSHLQKVTIRNVLGMGTIHLNHDIPTKIIAKSALGNIELPNQTNVVWGKKIYETANANGNKPLLELRIENALGHIKIR